jgi:hypothetical protein
MEVFRDATHVSEPERKAFNAIVDTRFVDVVRPFTPGPGVYTYWDYTQLAFQKRRGMRIDFIRGSPRLAERVVHAEIVKALSCWGWDLTAEAVQGAALALEGVHHVEGRDRLAAGVLGVGDGVADHVLKEHLEDTAGLLVDEARDALDTAAASQAPDGGLGDTLDVVAQDLAVPLGAALSESLSA